MMAMTEYIEREPLLKAIKDLCCGRCPAGYDPDKCHGKCDAADEIEIIENAPAANLNPV